MAFREVDVIEVREVLRGWLDGGGLRPVAERALPVGHPERSGPHRPPRRSSRRVGRRVERGLGRPREPDEFLVEPPAFLGDGNHFERRAGERAIARLGARRLGTCRVPVIYSPEMARGLYAHFLGAIRGTSQYRRASFLQDAAGQQVFPSFLQMQERPRLPRALASASFDAEGVATRDRELVRDGVLDGYVLGSYSARKLGLATTGNAGGVHNLLVGGAPAASDDFAGLLARMRRGLHVTELLGQGVNGVTGDYSRGASGFWIEDGAIAYPVHEITIAGNLRDMYRGIVAVGTDVDVRGGIRCGSVLLEGLTVAGE